MTLFGSTPMMMKVRMKARMKAKAKAKTMKAKAKAMKATNKVMKDCRNYNNSIYLTLKHFLE
jgi:hypothetical protein